MTRIFLMLMALLLAAPPLSCAQPGAAGGATPIEISSERMEAFGGERRIHFLGRVVARQDDVVIHADELRILLAPGEQDIEEMEALGNVRVIQGARVATGARGVFQRQRGVIVLTGSPRVQQGADFVEGDEITFFLHEERSLVTAGESNGRVRAVFQPREPLSGEQNKP